MAGIYLHIPFCRRACHYCNFHFSTSQKLRPELVSTLLLEIAERKEYLDGAAVSTIYFGGGTPSLLSQAEIDAMLNAIHTYYPVSGDAEITFEANPDDIDLTTAKAWKSAGINRLSMGVQSFYEEDLKWMNRAHTAGQALSSVRDVQNAGFTNITIDLIYGSPGLTDDKWKHNVDTALALNVPHLSCYALTVESQTALDKMITLKKSPPVHTEDQARQFTLLMGWLEDAGYDHYEISNFSKPGMFSRHNSAYWSGDHYLGFGPSAHSYNGSSRQWNVSNNAAYIKALTTGAPAAELEELTARDRHNEFVMISLRKKEGIRKSLFAELFGQPAMEQLTKSIKKFTNTDVVRETESTFELTNKGKLFADGIAADLFI
jgi:oxygen-independent coproporphyrinogen III oxidase